MEIFKQQIKKPSLILLVLLLIVMLISSTGCSENKENNTTDTIRTPIQTLKIKISNNEELWFHPLFSEKPEGIKFYKDNDVEITNWQSWSDLTEATKYSIYKPGVTFKAYTTVDTAFEKGFEQKASSVFKNVKNDHGYKAAEINDDFKNKYCVNGITVTLLDNEESWSELNSDSQICGIPKLSGVCYSNLDNNGFYNVYSKVYNALSNWACYTWSNTVFNSTDAYYWDGKNSLWYTSAKSDVEASVVLSKVFS